MFATERDGLFRPVEKTLNDRYLYLTTYHFYAILHECVIL